MHGVTNVAGLPAGDGSQPSALDTAIIAEPSAGACAAFPIRHIRSPHTVCFEQPSHPRPPGTTMLTARFCRPSTICRALAAFAIIGAPTLARAQADVEVIPYFATYYPLSSLGFNNEPDQDITVKQGSAPMAGARVRVRITDLFSIEGSVAYGSSPITGLSDDPEFGEIGFALSGNILIANGRLIYRLPRSNLYLLGGAGLVQRGGDFWDLAEDAEKTSIGGVIGAGVRAAVTPRFALDVAVEANLYSVDPDGEGTDFDSKFQQDFLVIIGVPIPIAGR